MGYWSVRTFGSDESYDWYDKYCLNKDVLNEISNLFQAILFSNIQFLKIKKKKGIEILVAAEIIASILGNEVDNFPDKEYHEDTLGRVPEIKKNKLIKHLDLSLVKYAILSVKEVRNSKSSELRESWEKSSKEDYNNWLKDVSGLVKRLEEGVPPQKPTD